MEATMIKVRICAFADEASPDLMGQIAALKEEGISLIELRGVNGRGVAELTEEEARAVRRRLDENAVSVWAPGSPIGKIAVGDDFQAHLAQAEHLFRLAAILGTERVRIFSFYTSAPERDEETVFARLDRLAELAASYRVKLYHENEKAIYGDTAERCVRLLNAVPGLGCVYDPANFVQSGEDIDKAHRLLFDRADYFHIKDARCRDGAVLPAGEGDGGLRRLIGSLARDTVLTLEPHLAVFAGYERLDRTGLRGSFVYPSQRAAFAAAAEALRVLLRENAFREVNGTWIK